MKRVGAFLDRFFFEPATARPLGALRIGLGAVLLAQAWLIRPELLELFGSQGIVQGDLAQYLSFPGTPQLSWFLPFFRAVGLDEGQSIFLVASLYILALMFFTSGLFTRTATIATWSLHWILMNTGYTTNYGADLYAHVFLFYLMFMPAGRAFSADLALGRVSAAPTPGTRLALRVLQLHLCLSYLSSGIDKAMGEQWWNGELLWRALSLPVYRQFDMSWLAHFPWLSKLGGWTTLLFETGYCIFIWPKATRYLWIAGMIGLHLGIAVFLGLGVFGSLMCVLTPAVFGFSAEPQPATEPLRSARPAFA